MMLWNKDIAASSSRPWLWLADLPRDPWPPRSALVHPLQLDGYRRIR